MAISHGHDHNDEKKIDWPIAADAFMVFCKVAM